MLAVMAEDEEGVGVGSGAGDVGAEGCVLVGMVQSFVGWESVFLGLVLLVRSWWGIASDDLQELEGGYDEGWEGLKGLRVAGWLE